MQRDPFRIVWRAFAAGVVIAGIATGIGCSKQSDTTSTPSSSAAGGMSPAPSVVPGTPGSGPAMSGASAASAPSGSSS